MYYFKPFLAFGLSLSTGKVKVSEVRGEGNRLVFPLLWWNERRFHHPFLLNSHNDILNDVSLPLAPKFSTKLVNFRLLLVSDSSEIQEAVLGSLTVSTSTTWGRGVRIDRNRGT